MRVSHVKNIDAFLGGPARARGARPALCAADLLVFPSRADTFGLVMVEALACGTPAAAYPVDGPLEVLARPKESGSGAIGGAMHEELERACYAARVRALDFSWREAARLFQEYLVPHVTKPSSRS